MMNVASKLIVNIAAYRFAPLEDLPARKTRLQQQCNRAQLKGTILLSPEGINLFVAGAGEAIESLLAELRSWPGLSDLNAKVSHTATQPFRRMLVRVKKEIIAFGVVGIEPGKHTSAKIAPVELKRRVDEGRPLTLLDTRNDYEVKLGTFKNARVLGLEHFRDFPDKARALPEVLKHETIVMFCTGGIRCEKAGPLMEREGFTHVYQLDGGILKYFEDCGAAHYDGECFVFDQRVGVNAELQETDASQCFNCQEPLTSADQNDARYVPSESCPACYRTPLQRTEAAIVQRQARIRELCTPLPGSRPADQFKPINVPRACDGGTLLQALRSVVPQVSEETWHCECARDWCWSRAPALTPRGCTNQIRVHLWHLGWPVCGDPAYRPGQTLGATQSLSPEEAPLQLHAWQLRFRHPRSWEWMQFTAPPPAWWTGATVQAASAVSAPGS